MKLGILGQRGAGKSTLFDLLTGIFEGPDFSADPTRPRIRSVKLEDPRLRHLERDYKPRKCTPAAFELYDFPAVSREGDRGGIADLLAPARDLNALFTVLRGFEAPGQPAPDIEGNLGEVLSEFLLADLMVVEGRLERLEAKSRKPQYSGDDRKDREILERIRQDLESSRSLRDLDFTPDERKRIGGFGFLSGKPLVIVVNQGDGNTGSVDSLGEKGGYAVLAVSLENELEISRLPPGEQGAFLEEYGIEKLSRDDLIAAGYRAAGLISFFTAGDKEVRAWTLRKGATAVEAAGGVHTDMARGFIRAETVSYEDYVRFGNVKGAREKGHLRLEGKDYVFQDGDIVEFRFSV